MAHRFQHDFARVNVSEQSEAERNGPEQNRNDFEPSDDEKDEDHEDLEEAGGFSLRTEKMQDEAADAIGLDRPDDPANKKDRRHREGQVQIGIGAAEQRPVDMKRAGGIMMAPADGADARHQTEPVQKKDENEDRGEEPEGLLHQLPADNVF